MATHLDQGEGMPHSDSQPHEKKSFNCWTNVVLAAVLMLATLPGRTQGLGLVTEPLLKDLHLDRLAYANINLWATLLGAVCCLPAGALLDRFGTRIVSGVLLLSLGFTVWAMSDLGGGLAMLFGLVLLTRGLGQSALSVVSITCVGKSFRTRVGLAMGVYSVLLSVLFATAFGLVGHVVTARGWRNAWFQIAVALIFVITPTVLIFLREQPGAKDGAKQCKLSSPATADIAGPKDGCAPTMASMPASSLDFTLPQALQTSAFWIFGGATALFGLVS